MVKGRNTRMVGARITDELYGRMCEVMKLEGCENVSEWIKGAIADRVCEILVDEPSGKTVPLVPGNPGGSALKGGNPRQGLSKIGQNDPCPCGSGKKYKKCCGYGTR